MCYFCIDTVITKFKNKYSTIYLSNLRNLYMKIAKKILVFALAFSLTACNTVSGLGDDLKKASEWTKDKLSK